MCAQTHTHRQKGETPMHVRESYFTTYIEERQTQDCGGKCEQSDLEGTHGEERGTHKRQSTENEDEGKDPGNGQRGGECPGRDTFKELSFVGLKRPHRCGTAMGWGIGATSAGRRKCKYSIRIQATQLQGSAEDHLQLFDSTFRGQHSLPGCLGALDQHSATEEWLREIRTD